MLYDPLNLWNIIDPGQYYEPEGLLSITALLLASLITLVWSIKHKAHLKCACGFLISCTYLIVLVGWLFSAEPYIGLPRITSVYIDHLFPVPGSFSYTMFSHFTAIAHPEYWNAWLLRQTMAFIPLGILLEIKLRPPLQHKLYTARLLLSALGIALGIELLQAIANLFLRYPNFDIALDQMFLATVGMLIGSLLACAWRLLKSQVVSHLAS